MHSLILLNNREKDVTHEMIEEKIRELKPKHSDFAAVLEVIHQMDLKQTVNAFIVVESLRQVLKIHASRLASQ
jgi:superfamily II DNA/RNA helicase